MRTKIRVLVFIGFAVFICGTNLIGEISPGVTLVRSAGAFVGAPLTPYSAAGVARRTTRRVVGATAVVATSTAATATAASAAATAQPAAPPPPPATPAVPPPSAPPAAPPAPTNASAVPVGTVVQALPAGCVSVVEGGVSYSECSGTFFKAAFQGNNLVYVVVPKPMP